MDQPFRGQRELRLGDRVVRLCLDWNAVAVIALMAERRAKPDGDLWKGAEWPAWVQDRLEAYAVEDVAKIIEAAAMRHDPDLMAEDVLAASPPWLEVRDAVGDLVIWFHWGPGGLPEDEEQKEGVISTGPLARLFTSLRRFGLRRGPDVAASSGA